MGELPMPPAPTSLADLFERTSHELAASDGRVYRRVGDHLLRSHAALDRLEGSVAPDAAPALLGKGDFGKQSVAKLKALCRTHALRGYSRLNRDGLVALLEAHGVVPPPPPLESLSKQELLQLVRELLAAGHHEGAAISVA